LRGLEGDAQRLGAAVVAERERAAREHVGAVVDAAVVGGDVGAIVLAEIARVVIGRGARLAAGARDVRVAGAIEEGDAGEGRGARVRRHRVGAVERTLRRGARVAGRRAARRIPERQGEQQQRRGKSGGRTHRPRRSETRAARETARLIDAADDDRGAAGQTWSA
jgi:hypothetical protein